MVRAHFSRVRSRSLRPRAATRGLALALAAVVSACEPTTAPVQPIAPTLVSFALAASEHPALGADVPGVIANDTVTLVLPVVTDVRALVPRFVLGEPESRLSVAGQQQTSGVSAQDFSGDVTYTLTSATGHARGIVVRVIVVTGLPVVTVTTVGGAPILDRENYVDATVAIYGGKQAPAFSIPPVATQIRGRGNSTWGAPKKPYRLKLATSASLLGIPADRDFTLLANYWDLTLLRNALAFELGARMSAIEWTPRCRSVELILNGARQGAYQLCDHVEVSSSRVRATSAGWFLEVVNLPRVEPGETYFRSPALDAWSMQSDSIPSVWVYKQPDPPTVEERARIEGELLRLEAVLYGEGFAHPDTGYAAHLNVDATIDWFLVQELAKNNDAAFFNSTFAYKAPTGRITVGPLWDFDLAFGNYPWDAGPEGWKVRDGAWIERLFVDPAFRQRLKARWQTLYAQRADIDAWLVARAAAMDRSQQENHAQWSPYDFPKPLLRASDAFAATTSPRQMIDALSGVDYGAELAALRSWLAARFEWMHSMISAY